MWPENLTAANVMVAMDKQWRIGMNGRYAMDYGVLPAVMDLLEVPAVERKDVFECLRIMEDAALMIFNKDR